MASFEVFVSVHERHKMLDNFPFSFVKRNPLRNRPPFFEVPLSRCG